MADLLTGDFLEYLDQVLRPERTRRQHGGGAEDEGWDATHLVKVGVRVRGRVGVGVGVAARVRVGAWFRVRARANEDKGRDAKGKDVAHPQLA